MKKRFKGIDVVSHLNDSIEKQRTRYLEYKYQPDDYISKTRIKEKTNNIR
ncbi:MAG: hypothetical protein WDA24_09685 [Tissierellales bacterium]